MLIRYSVIIPHTCKITSIENNVTSDVGAKNQLNYPVPANDIIESIEYNAIPTIDVAGLIEDNVLPNISVIRLIIHQVYQVYVINM